MNIETLKTAAAHAAVTIGLAALVTLGAAMVGFGPTTNVSDWLRNLGVVEVGVVGSKLAEIARGYMPKAS